MNKQFGWWYTRKIGPPSFWAAMALGGELEQKAWRYILFSHAERRLESHYLTSEAFVLGPRPIWVIKCNFDIISPQGRTILSRIYIRHVLRTCLILPCFPTVNVPLTVSGFEVYNWHRPFLITEMSVSKWKIKTQPAAKRSQVGIGMSFWMSLGQTNMGLGLGLTVSADNSCSGWRRRTLWSTARRAQ